HADVRVVYRASTLADLAAHLGTDNQDIRIPPNLIADGDEHITPAQLTLVALSTVFDAPVLSALAERLEAENTEVLPPIPLAPRDGRIALSLAQQRLWFLTQLEGVSE
ncbi:hypothetical protein, partial [Burkholderia pseudomallei]|uniref:hypothetical protein n=1 Tax=Burkholderia pseudomallei TaxID=28450 RepID=UPI0018A6B586